MNYLAAIGIETWRNSRALPGAKTEVFARCYEFFDESGVVIRIICQNNIHQTAQLLLNHFCRAIEIVFHYRNEVKVIKSIQDFSGSPVLILGEGMAAGVDPDTVMKNPLLKVTWWKLITTMINEGS